MPSTREKWPWHDVAVRDFRLPKKLWPPSISNAAAATAAIDTPRPRHSLEPRDFTTTHRNFGSFTESLMREGHSDFYGGRKKKTWTRPEKRPLHRWRLLLVRWPYESTSSDYESVVDSNQLRLFFVQPRTDEDKAKNKYPRTIAIHNHDRQ